MPWGKRKKKEIEEAKEAFQPPTPPKTETEKPVRETERFTLKSYVTQSESRIVDTETNEEYDVLTALVLVLNALDEINETING